MTLLIVVMTHHGCCDDNVQAVVEDGFPDNEISMAKEQTLNGFVFNFASTEKQLARACIYALLDIPQACMHPSLETQELNGILHVHRSQRQHCLVVLLSMNNMHLCTGSCQEKNVW